jgi:hypothetical protein
MPLGQAEDFGTDADGARADEYCRFCFEKGAFTEPGLTHAQMVEKCAGILERRGIMPLTQARAVMADLLPTLRRWKAP